jgi:hypothetical protein
MLNASLSGAVRLRRELERWQIRAGQRLFALNEERGEAIMDVAQFIEGAFVGVKVECHFERF